jgi:hypothetical protein
MELLEIENGALSQQIVFSDVLLVVPVFHLFLVNVINKLLDSVLAVCL